MVSIVRAIAAPPRRSNIVQWGVVCCSCVCVVCVVCTVLVCGVCVLVFVLMVLMLFFMCVYVALVLCEAGLLVNLFFVLFCFVLSSLKV